jgi:transcriptional regulator with XRE-family HTH domain
VTDLSSRTGRGEPPFRAVRLARGLTLAEVAQRAHVDESHLSRVERGEKGCSVALMHRLAAVLGLDELERITRPYIRGGDG